MKRFSMAMTWLALAGLMTMVSCRKPVVGFTNGEARTVTVSAVTENGGGSKTAIDGLKVNWSKGDKIKMNGCVLTLEDECAGSTMGRFTGKVTDNAPYYIGYPADNTTCAGATVKLNIQAEWAYADMKEIVPMVAYAADVDDDVYFRNAVNMLKLQLKGVGDDDNANKLKRIVLTSTTSNLSGDISVEFDGEGNPTFNAITDGGSAKKTMTVLFGDGLQLGNTVKCVYIPLAKINGGDLTVRFVCANGKYMERKVTATSAFNAVNNMLSDELTVNATDKDHEAVNMGLPEPYENLEWSVYNLGVDPEDLDAAADWYGDYYAWGEVLPYYDDGHSQDNPCSTWRSNATGAGNTDLSSGYAWKSYSQGGTINFTEWTTIPYDANSILTSDHDAATANWGGDWRMPTSAELQALYDNNTFEWLEAGSPSTNVTGFTAVAAGYLVVKGKDASLDPSVYMFLPAAGYRGGTSLSYAGSFGYYWSSSLYSSNPISAYNMYFFSGYVFPPTDGNRVNGWSVRPVR